MKLFSELILTKKLTYGKIKQNLKWIQDSVFIWKGVNMENDLNELISESFGRRQTTQEWVTNVLREAILRGYYDDGIPLETTKLAEQLGVSRMPVRAALLQLENEGLVTQQPHKKAVATKLSAEEVKKIYEIRYELESLATKLAIVNLTTEDIEFLETKIIEMDNVKSIDEFVSLNKEFHNRLSELSDNKILTDINRQLRNNVDRYLRLYISDDYNIYLANKEHKELLEAIKAKDVDVACKVMRKHLSHTCEAVVKFLEERKKFKEK